jgi:hypothetical protein
MLHIYKYKYIYTHVSNPTFTQRLVNMKHAGFEVFMAVTMKNAILWDVAPCGFIINRRFGGMCRLHLHGIRNNASKEKC